MTNCGACDESCCTSLEVQGGTFFRTYANDGGGPTGLADPATVSSFRLDKYEVTVGRFRQFVHAALLPDGGAGWLPPVGSGKHTHLNGGQGLQSVGPDGGVVYESGWFAKDDALNVSTASYVSPTNVNLACSGDVTWTPSVGSRETLPITCTTWYEAYAFCIWDGGFLPSDAEREYASAGGSQQREYPWGTTDPGTRNEYAIYGCFYPTGSATCALTTAHVAPVGTATLGAGLWGQLDLVGSLTDWNLDWAGPYLHPCIDCAKVRADPGTPVREAEGGGFYLPATYLSLPARSGARPDGRNGMMGVRCARTP
jgi:formylglycine-generating enzyme required for sulfatase activity